MEQLRIFYKKYLHCTWGSMQLPLNSFLQRFEVPSFTLLYNLTRSSNFPSHFPENQTSTYLLANSMKPLPTEVLKAPISIIVTVFSLLSLFFLLLTHRSSSPDQSPRRPFISKVTAIPKRPPLLPPRWVERMGIVDDFGAMAEEFLVGDYDPALVLEWANFSGHQRRIGGGGGVLAAPVESYGICEERMRDYIPCLDSMEIGSVNSGSRGEKYERHCPPEGEGLNCLVPPPEGYRKPVPWPQSRNKVEDDKGGPNMTISNRDKFIFPGRADYYVNQISQMVPEIAFGNQTRVVLDIGRGEASFGYILSQHNVTTLSIAPQDDNENPIQLVLDRGLPAMVAVFGTHRLLYPSQAFDLIHCHRCTINWTRDDGILLLEANRILRAGGYFVWSPQPTKNHENLEVQWKEIKDLTSRICWKLVRKEKEIGIWQKVFNNTCYFNRDTGVQPSICDSDDDPDNVWYINLKSCITLLPKNCYGANVTSWPARLHHLPDRLQSIKIDAQVSRKEIFIAESKYWNEIIDGYVRAYHWKELKFRNVMDMRAGFGGFAAALLDFQIVCWVMNVVPVSGFNTLPVIYDRGLIGVAHDWCEPFDTYPRSYDLLHAAGLFSTEQKRCNISTIMLEMDRMLRPSGHVYIHDSVSVIGQVKEIAAAMGWVTTLHETGEGPHSNWKVLVGEKRS